MTWKGIYTYRQRWKTAWTFPRYIGLVQWLAFDCVPHSCVSAVVSRIPREVKMYLVEECVFLVRKYWQTDSFKACQTAFRKEFGERRAPSKYCIQKLVKNLETTRRLLTQHTGGRKMFEGTIHDVKERLLASPSKSLRRLSQETNLPYSTCQRDAKKAKLRAYRVSCVQVLLLMDHEKRVRFC